MTPVSEVLRATISPPPATTPVGSAVLRVQTFGNSVIDVGDWHLKPTAARAFALLLYLATERGRRVPRSVVLGLIFGDQSEPNASHSLRQLLYKLRQSGAVLESNVDEIAIGADEVRLDYAELLSEERLTAEQLEQIRGGFLRDFAPTLTEAYSEWLDAFRASTTLELRRVLVRELARARSVADWRSGERAARACLALDPLNEEATLGLAEALAAAGSKVEAVELLDRYLADMGTGSADLRLPASLLRRRISERLTLPYRSQPELPFVGREHEMLLLGDRFHRARAGESQCVVLHGEAGIGKSRLAAEFATVAALDGARVVRVVAQPHDVHRPMGAFVDLVPLLLELPGALGCSPESMAALKRLTTHSPGTVDLRIERSIDEAFYPITTAIDDLVDAIVGEVPLVVTIDDAQWTDSMSKRLLIGLVSDRRPRRLLVLLGARALDPLGPLITDADPIVNVTLVGIGAKATEQLVAGALAGSAAESDAELQEWMVRTTCGNPLFIAFVTLHYISTCERFAVPPSLSNLLARRLDLIDGRAHTVLMMCVILGKYCTVDRLVTATDLGHADLLESVRDLELAHLLVDDRITIAAVHGLVADSVLSRTTRAVLRLAHYKVASILEREAEGSASAATWWDCADHWAAAASYQRAVASFRRCANHSLAIGRPREAAQFLTRAIDLSLPMVDRASLAKDLILAADAGSEYVAALRGVQVLAKAGHSHVHDDLELAELRALLHVTDSIEPAAERLLACVACSTTGHAHRARAGVLLMMLAHHESRRTLAESANLFLADVLPELADTPEGLNLALVYHSGFGNIEQAAANARTLLATSSGLTQSAVASAQANAARALWIAGYSDEAIAALEESYRACVAADLFRLREVVASHLGSHHLDLERRSDGRSREWHLIAEHIAAHTLDWRSTDYLVNRAEAALFDDDIAAAREHLRALANSEYAERSGQAQRWVRALGMRIAQLQGRSSVNEATMAELVERLGRPSSAEVSDLEAAVVLEALISTGDESHARVLLNDYLTENRLLRSPMDALLWKVGNELAGSSDRATTLAAI